MKILSLRLSNLASIAGEQHIDFEQEPLKTAGLIAITGITGAGKTTLLDAICLALFDQVPRLQHAEANKKM
ncbi:AAA family ATPase, partial [Rhizobium hidalgonense]